MTVGDAVFAADGAHIGRLTALDEEWLTVTGEGHSYRVPRDKAAYTEQGRVFLAAPNRNAVHLWRVDVRGASGLRGWWERRVLGPSQRQLGGRLAD
jgi:hypothetical protein